MKKEIIHSLIFSIIIILGALYIEPKTFPQVNNYVFAEEEEEEGGGGSGDGSSASSAGNCGPSCGPGGVDDSVLGYWYDTPVVTTPVITPSGIIPIVPNSGGTIPDYYEPIYYDPCVSNTGSECAVSNACGQQGFGSITCSGECTASAPPNPSYYLTPCTSSPNTCGLRNFGSTQCDQTCSATFPPAEISCTTLNSSVKSTVIGIDGKPIVGIDGKPIETELTLMANPKFTGLNGFSDLTWVGNGSCNLYDNDGTIIASSTSGTLRIGPVARSVRYILSCGTQNVSVTVAPSTTFQEF